MGMNLNVTTANLPCHEGYCRYRGWPKRGMSRVGLLWPSKRSIGERGNRCDQEVILSFNQYPRRLAGNDTRHKPIRKQSDRTLTSTDSATTAAATTIKFAASIAAFLVASCAGEPSVPVRPPFDESSESPVVPSEGIRNVAAGDVCLNQWDRHASLDNVGQRLIS